MPTFREPTVLNPAGYQEVLSSAHTLLVPGSISVGTDASANPEIKFFNGPGLTLTSQTNLSVTDALQSALKILTDSGLAQFAYSTDFSQQLALLTAQLQSNLQLGEIPVGDGTGGFTSTGSAYDPTKRQELAWAGTGAEFKTALSFSVVAPTASQVGEFWIDQTFGTTNPALKVWDGTQWSLVSDVGGPVDLGQTVTTGDLYVGDPGNSNPALPQTATQSDLARLSVGSANQILTVDENGDYPEWRTWFYYTNTNTPPAGAQNNSVWLDTLTNQVGVYDEAQNIWYRSYFNNKNLNDIAEEAFVDGDLIRRGATRLEALSVGNEHDVLRVTGGSPNWEPLIHQGPTPPPTPSPSDLWFDTAAGQLSIAESAGASIIWQPIGSQVVRMYRDPAETIRPGYAVFFAPGGLVLTDTDAVATRSMTGIALREDPLDDTFWFVAVDFTCTLSVAQWQAVTTEADVTGLTPGSQYWLTDVPGQISKFRPTSIATNGNYDSYVGQALSNTMLLIKPNSDLSRYTTSLHYMNDVTDTIVASVSNAKGILIRDGDVAADASPAAYKLVSLVDLGNY